MKRRKKAKPARRSAKKRRPAVRRRIKQKMRGAVLVPAPPPPAPVFAPIEENPTVPPGWDRLTPMQKRVLQLVAAGRNTNEIAAELGASPNTVQAHRVHLAVRLGLRGRSALQQFAMKHKARM